MESKRATKELAPVFPALATTMEAQAYEISTICFAKRLDRSAAPASFWRQVSSVLSLNRGN